MPEIVAAAELQPGARLLPVISFATPQWFAVLALFALLGWVVRPLKLWQPLRAACLIVLAAWLADPSVRWGNAGVEVTLLVDRSISAEALLEPRLAEWEMLLRDGMRPGDTLRIVDFAEAPVEREPGVVFEPGRNASNLRLALDFARTRRHPARQARFLVFTDGFSTESLASVSRRLEEEGIPLRYRLVKSEAGGDSRVVAFELPASARPGESFLIQADLEIAFPGTPYQLRRAGEVIASGTIEEPGFRRLRFFDRVQQPGAQEYEIELLPVEDRYETNNRRAAWVVSEGGGRVLLVSAYRDDPLFETFRLQGREVELVTDYSSLGVGRLSGADLVVLNNVPAYELPPEFLEALPFHIEGQGASLLMGGGRFSFGAGGYFGSPIDPLLPVSTELKQDLRKMAVGLAVVLDRSGSMSAGVTGGMTKMNLAAEGAARAIELLGPRDQVSVHAVDTFAHEIVPMVPIDQSKLELARRVRGVESLGGGIFVFEGLKAGWEALQAADVERRHLILFSDAADSEEPGGYRELLAEMRAAEATVSVIALGSEEDPDAELLREIADLGGGRVFFNADPMQLPSLFSMETVAVARSAFIDEPTGTRATGSWIEISPAPLDWLPAVGGYNLSYLRPEAASALQTTDSYDAPLVAWWNRGAGRTGAISFPVAGEFSTGVREWPRYGEFLRTFVDWLAPSEDAEGSLLETTVEGNELRLDLYFDESWFSRLAQGLPQLQLAQGVRGDPEDVPWARVAPGHLRARVALPAGDFLRGVALLGSDRWTFGPVSGAADPETEFDPARPAELREVAARTGGGELFQFEEIWEREPEAGFRPLRPLLLVLLLVLFLAEVAAVRLGRAG